jgi:CHAD domain-containing protein
MKDTTVQSDLMQQTGVVEKELLQMKPKEFATKILQRRHRQLHKKLMISRHTSEQFHELRLELKKLRYAMDFFNSFYQAKKVSAYLKPLTKIQELLGQMNDMVSAQALLATSDQSSFEIFTAWIKGRESGYFVILPRAVKGLVQLPEPWKK